MNRHANRVSSVGFRVRRMVWFLAFGISFAAGAFAAVKDWTFTVPADYQVTSDDDIEVANDTARLRLHAQELHNADVYGYFSNAVSSSAITYGPDISMRLKQTGGVYERQGIFTSRTFDGGAGNVWHTLNATAYNFLLENAGGQFSPSTSNIVAIFHFDNDNWLDAVNGRNGTPTSLTFTNSAKVGSHSGYWSGDISPQHLQFLYNPTISLVDEITISFWIKTFDSERQGEQYAFSIGTDTWNMRLRVGATGASTAVDPRAISLYYKDGFQISSAIEGTWTAAKDDGAWHHIAVVYNKNASPRTRLYKDGVLLPMKNDTISGALGPVAGIAIGQVGTWRLKGQVDEVAVFNKALTEEQVIRLYEMPIALIFQVRAATTTDNLATNAFVGPDSTPTTFYGIENQTLVEGGGFRPSGRYAQYKAYFSSPADGSQTPFLDAVGLLGSMKNQFDNTYGDFIQGEFTQNVEVFPSFLDTPYLGLNKQRNGGYYQNGAYTSRVLDGGLPGTFWRTLSWVVPAEQPNTDSGLIALWHLDGGFTDATAGQHNDENPVNVTYTDLAKLGRQAAVFNGASSSAHIGSLGSSKVKTIEFWINDKNADDSIVEFYPGAYIALSNRLIRAAGYPSDVPEIFVNGSAVSRRIGPGWNHVAVVSAGGVMASNLYIGVANNDYMQGALDEIAAYSRDLYGSEIKSHYISGARAAAGSVKFQVRADSLNPPTTAFVGPGNSPSAYFTSPSGATLPTSVWEKRYLQYRAYLAGDGDSTPAVKSVTVTLTDGTVSSFTDDTIDEIAQGSFDNGATKWLGDDVALPDLSLVPGLANLDPVTAESLEGLWHMDESSWGTGATVLDSTSYNRHGTPQNGATISAYSKVGSRCGWFNGVNQYVNLPTITLSSDFTISAWFKTAAATRTAVLSRSDGAYIIEINGNGTGAYPGNMAFVISDGSSTKIAPAAIGGLNDDAWHNVTAIRHGDHIYLYIDGIPAGATYLGAFGGLPGAQQTQVARHSGLNTYLNGLIDEVMIFSRALSEAEVKDNMAMGNDFNLAGEYVGKVLDAAGAAIWETIGWREDGIYGDALTPGDTELVGLWHADESSGLVVSNSAGGNDGTIDGSVSRGNGKFGKCLSFNGSGGKVDIADSLVLEPAQLSVEAWVYANAVDNRVIFDKRDAANGYALAMDADAKPYLWIAGTECKSRAGVRRAVWTHVAGTYDGSEMRVYVNGEIAGVKSLAGPNMSAGDARIGKGYDNNGSFDGLIDEIAIHSSALGAEEATDHSRVGLGTLHFQARAGDTANLDALSFIGPDKTTSAFFEDAFGSSMVGSIPLGRYFQYKFYLSAVDGLRAPRLQGLTVDQSRYPTENPWVMPGTGKGQAFPGNLVSFSHALATNTDSAVRYQISGNDGINWHWWNSVNSQWEDVTGFIDGWDLANEWSQINANIGSYYRQLYDKVGGTFTFKAFMHSGGNDPTAIDNVSLGYAPGRIVVDVPNGLENGDDAWLASVSYNVEWSWSGTVSDNLTLEYSLTGIQSPSWQTIATGVARGAGGKGTNVWKTPSTTQSTNVYVRARDANDSGIYDTSDSAFSIVRRFQVITPNGGEKWYITYTNGLPRTNGIVWASSYNLGTLVKLDFAPDGINFTPQTGGYEIKYATANFNETTNTYYWVPPTTEPKLLSQSAKIRVEKPTGGDGDASDGFFTMAGIIVMAPAQGAKVKRNADYPIYWASAGAGSSLAMDYSGDGGQTFTNLYASVPNALGTNSFVWNVTQPGTDSAMLRFRSLSDTNIVGYSPIFTLADIEVTSPDEGDDWLMNTTNTITWTSGGAGNFVNIYYSTNSGQSWMTIASRVANSSSYNWLVPPYVSKYARIMVESDEDTNLWSVSRGDFNIAGARVTYPDVKEHRINKGETYWFKHDAAPERWRGARLEISYDDGNNYGFLGEFADNWNLGEIFQFTPTYPATKAKFRVTVNESPPFTNVFDVSDERITVAGILVQAPLVGETYTIGETKPIKWFSAGAGYNASVYYSNEGTNNFIKLDEQVNNNDGYPAINTYDWTVPANLIPSEDARVKIEAGDYSHMSDVFTVRGIRITRPDSNTVWEIGIEPDLGWIEAGISDTARAKFSLSLDGGQTFPYPIVDARTLEPATNYAVVDIPYLTWDMADDYDPTTNAVVRIKIMSSDVAADTNIVAYSDPFTLRGVKILSPASGDNWELGSTTDIVFIAAAAGSTATISYSPNGGSSYEASPIVAMNIVNGRNTNAWTIEDTRQPSTNARIKVVGATVQAVSPVFTVGGVKVLRPMQYDIWAAGETNLIEWISVGTHGTNIIDLIFEDQSTYRIADAYVGTSLNWLTVSNALPAGLETASNVVLRVRDTGGYQGLSEPFVIVSEPVIYGVSPKPGEFWKVGDTKTISWIKGGHMEKEDFRVYWSQDGFVSSREELDNLDITFDPTANKFSLDWDIQDRILTPATKILVTNVVNSKVFYMFEEFYLCGNLRVDYPNGSADEEIAYALDERINAKWYTRGEVGYVDLYYRDDTNAWVKINSVPISDRGKGEVEKNNSVQWIPPNLQSTKVRFRVQDSDYTTNIFDGVTPGPYDDSDNIFDVRYFNIYWDVAYYDAELRVTNRLDELSVTDSSGWSQSGLSCKQAPILHKYPYGTYDTVWYREYFQNYVDFHWVCNTNNMTRYVEMVKTETEPTFNVLANFTYNVSNRAFTVLSWLERGASILSDPNLCTVTVYDEYGALIEVVLSTSPDSNGVFRLVWDVAATETNRSSPEFEFKFQSTDIFYAKVEIQFSGQTYGAGVTFALRESPDMEIVDEIRVIVEGMESNIQTNIDTTRTNITGKIDESTTAVTGKIEEARSEIITAVATTETNITSRIDASTTALTGEIRAGTATVTGALEEARSEIISAVETNTGLLTGTVIPGIGFITNQLVGVIGPAVTDIAKGVTNTLDVTTNILDVTGSGLARILTRPIEVVYGSTNAILYKTRRGYQDQVFITVSNEIQGIGQTAPVVDRQKMTEVVGGIYEYGLVAGGAGWGTNTYIVTCSDPLASDSMILRVVGEHVDLISPVLGALSNDLANVAVKVASIEDLLGTSSDTNILITVEESLSEIQEMLGESSDTNILVSVEQSLSTMMEMLGTDPATNMLVSVEKKISGIEKLLGQSSATNMLESVEKTLADMKNMLGESSDTNVLSSVNSALNDIITMIGTSSASNMLVTIEKKLGNVTDTASSKTFFGRLAGMSRRLDFVGDDAYDASKKAQTAKTEASDAANGIQELKARLAANNMDGAMSILRELKQSMGKTRQSIDQIPELIKIDGMYSSLKDMAATIERFSASKGFEYLVKFPEGRLGGGAGEAEEKEEKNGADEDAIMTLNNSMEEVRGSMQFMEKLLDEMRYEPVVEETLLGVK